MYLFEYIFWCLVKTQAAKQSDCETCPKWTNSLTTLTKQLYEEAQPEVGGSEIRVNSKTMSDVLNC